ncbi:MAG: hypothetical protein HFI60_03560 [Lachnospiraceae bacterium]|nr:hypothetical protein [Lachnospiraceae bacterium]
MIKYVGIMVGGIAIGIILDKMIIAVMENKKLEREKILEKCFGEPMYTSLFSMAEVRDWIKSRETLLQDGAKAIVLQANSETLKGIGKDLDIGNNLKNNLVIAIVDESCKNISDSVLIKYETLDARLDEALSKGNGVLVVEA